MMMMMTTMMQLHHPEEAKVHGRSSRVIFGLSSCKFMAQLSFPMHNILTYPPLNRPDLIAFYPIMLQPCEQPLTRLVIATVDVFGAN